MGAIYNNDYTRVVDRPWSRKIDRPPDSGLALGERAFKARLRMSAPLPMDTETRLAANGPFHSIRPKAGR